MIWLVGWAFGLLMVLSMGMTQKVTGGPELFVIVWLVLWVLGGLAVIAFLLWGFFGKEILTIKSNEVVFHKGIFGIGKTRRLQKSEVKNFRFNEVGTNWFSSKNRWAIYGLGEGKIKFDYGMRTYSLGLGLDDAEVNYLIEYLQGKI